jgi:hypothetical protein
MDALRRSVEAERKPAFDHPQKLAPIFVRASPSRTAEEEKVAPCVPGLQNVTGC